MRAVFWNCNMALHRKMEALMALNPDIAVIGECAAPEVLAARGVAGLHDDNCIWDGKNRNKGLGVFAFNGYQLTRAEPYHPTLRYVLPVHVTGTARFNLLAVWAQNASAGITRKRQSGPLRRAVGKYREFLTEAPAIIGGDLNNNRIWDRPGWRINHMTLVDILAGMGFASAYHELRGEAQGEETEPTHYWRDRTKDGPTYHIDYVFLPEPLLGSIREFSVGTFEDWCGNKLSDHVPLVVEVGVEE